MHFLSPSEHDLWISLERDIRTHSLKPGEIELPMRPLMVPMFHYHMGALSCLAGDIPLGRAWFNAGVLIEQEGVMSNGFMTSFLERNNGIYTPPAVVFEDPRPYMHFITMPIMQSARAAFLKQLENTLPRFEHPVRFMDIGCGDGSLTAEMLDRLRSSGKVDEYAEVLLIDGSAGMIEMARRLVAGHAPETVIKSSVHRIEEISDQITGTYDIVVSSLAYHHMPWEKKVRHLTNLRPHIENLIFFDLDANNDTPELGTPELSVSVFQSYGRLMDFVFAHDTSIELAVSCVDQFLVPEVISLLTEERGRRRDYHMLRAQWHQLQQEVLGTEFTCWSDALSYADEYIGLFTMHYGRS